MLMNLGQVPELRALSPLQRQRVLAHALQYLSVTEKIMLNIVKLIVLVPAFFWMAQYLNWLWLFPGTLALLMVFAFFCRPLQIHLARPHFARSVEETS